MAMKIIVYGTKKCPWTDKVKEWFEDRGITKYKFFDVVKDFSAREEMVRKSKTYTYPFIDMDGEFIKGFDKVKMNKALLN